MKLTLIIIALFGVGARGYFLPSGPSPIRGHLQGRIWPGHEKTVEGNRFLYHTPAFQQYLDYRGHGSLQNVVEQPYQQHYQPYQQIQPILPESYQGLQYLTRPPVTAQTTIPLVVKFPNNEAFVVPVRAVYTLPPFLERIVQRVQGYYSVYNPVEDLTLDRPLFTPTTPTSVPEISSPPEKTTTEKNKERLQEEEDATEAGDSDTTTEGETGDSTDATPTESGDDSATDSSGTDTPASESGDASGGYTYDKPARSFNTKK